MKKNTSPKERMLNFPKTEVKFLATKNKEKQKQRNIKTKNKTIRFQEKMLDFSINNKTQQKITLTELNIIKKEILSILNKEITKIIEKDELNQIIYTEILNNNRKKGDKKTIKELTIEIEKTILKSKNTILVPQVFKKITNLINILTSIIKGEKTLNLKEIKAISRNILNMKEERDILKQRYKKIKSKILNLNSKNSNAKNLNKLKDELINFRNCFKDPYENNIFEQLDSNTRTPAKSTKPQTICKLMQIAIIKKIIDLKLTEEDQNIIKWRYGLEGDKKTNTLEEIGEKIKMTREGVRLKLKTIIAKIKLEIENPQKSQTQESNKIKEEIEEIEEIEEKLKQQKQKEKIKRKKMFLKKRLNLELNTTDNELEKFLDEIINEFALEHSSIEYYLAVFRAFYGINCKPLSLEQISSNEYENKETRNWPNLKKLKPTTLRNYMSLANKYIKLYLKRKKEKELEHKLNIIA